jgi:hypothetical protein
MHALFKYLISELLTPWRRVIVEKTIIILSLSRNSLPYLEPERSRPCSQEPLSRIFNAIKLKKNISRCAL